MAQQIHEAGWNVFGERWNAPITRSEDSERRARARARREARKTMFDRVVVLIESIFKCAIFSSFATIIVVGFNPLLEFGISFLYANALLQLLHRDICTIMEANKVSVMILFSFIALTSLYSFHIFLAPYLGLAVIVVSVRTIMSFATQKLKSSVERGNGVALVIVLLSSASSIILSTLFILLLPFIFPSSNPFHILGAQSLLAITLSSVFALCASSIAVSVSHILSGIFRLHCDASFWEKERAVGLAFIIHNLNWNFKFAKAVWEPVTKDINVAEAGAMDQGLCLCQERGWNKIEVYADSKILVDMMNGLKSSVTKEMVDKVKAMKAKFAGVECKIKFIPRKKNALADAIAQRACIQNPEIEFQQPPIFISYKNKNKPTVFKVHKKVKSKLPEWNRQLLLSWLKDFQNL